MPTDPPHSTSLRSRLRSGVDRLNAAASSSLAAFSKRLPRTARFFGIIRTRRRPIFIIVHVILHIVGFFLSLQALMQTRTEQGAIAWTLSLNTVPIIAVPAWLVFGDSELDGYISTRRAGLGQTRPIGEKLLEGIRAAEAPVQDAGPIISTLGQLSSIPPTRFNHAELLVDGKNTYTSLFDSIDNAQHYILLQTYIYRADSVGKDLKQRLIEKARAGVQVYLLIDGLGSFDLPDGFFDDLRDAGGHASLFMKFDGRLARFQLNFRNHRKLAVIDGRESFIGGHNFGEEYLGMHPTMTPWRDSHVKLTGPVVKCAQVSFVEDWYLGATGDIIKDLDWSIKNDKPAGDMQAACIPSGPSDTLETCSLLFLTLINNAEERLWIASPYFVPDDKMVTALQLAAIRGVDVRVLIPEKTDSTLVHYSSFSYLEELIGNGVKIYRYTNGFMHQKVVLVDDDIAAVGSANFDNRSFRLNFEVSAVVKDHGFNNDVATMLEQDFAHSSPAKMSEYTDAPMHLRLLSRISRLLAPIQ